MSYIYELTDEGEIEQLKILKTGVELYTDLGVQSADLYEGSSGALVFNGFGKFRPKDEEPNYEAGLAKAKMMTKQLAHGCQLMMVPACSVIGGWIAMNAARNHLLSLCFYSRYNLHV